jgi:hypothetical protein
MGQRICIVVYLQLQSVESVGISWSQKESSERHNIIEKENLLAEAISSERNHLTAWSSEHDK